MAVIIPVEQLAPAFENAMDDLRRNNIEGFRTVGHMMAAWKKYYDCYLLHDQFYNWESVGFKNEEQFTWFMLKWS